MVHFGGGRKLPAGSHRPGDGPGRHETAHPRAVRPPGLGPEERLVEGGNLELAPELPVPEAVPA
jgi:hypothetical protein